jgi:hypothetical protein
MITFTPREFQFMQSFMSEMFQSAVLRDGPMGAMVTAVRDKFLVEGSVDLTDAERRFLLFSLNDVYLTSQNSVVKTQLGLQMQILRPTTEPVTVSEISDPDCHPRTGLSGTYFSMWQVMQSCMTKLGMSAPPPAPPLATGTVGQGDLNGISTPMHHDVRDGTGYNDQ